MRHVKTVPATYSVKADDQSEGWIVEGYASVFHNVDSYGDRVQPGAFKKTLGEQQGKIRFFWDHQTPLGPFLEGSEDDKGLKIRARISKTALGHDVKTLVEDGAVGDFSFGYDIVEDKCKWNEHGGLDLHEIKLYEVSLVGIGANSEAMLTGVKNLQSEQAAIRTELANLKHAVPDTKDTYMDTKAASGDTDLPIADNDTSWDGDAAEQAVAKWATNEDGELDVTKFGKAFFWKAEGAEKQGDFKLGFATVADGELKAVPAGVKAAAGAIQGARATPDIPESDVDGVKAKIATYYNRMELGSPPWAEDSDSSDSESGDSDDGKAAENVPGEDEESEAPTAAEVRAALKTLQALVDAYEEPSKDTLAQESEPPKEDDAELEKSLRAELDAMKSI